ncbi:MAG TPA: hypothetical protein PKX15_04425 [Bacteroidales bacterium]|nr:hypothetical protein [Bacteroidales bacterium]
MKSFQKSRVKLLEELMVILENSSLQLLEDKSFAGKKQQRKLELIRRELVEFIEEMEQKEWEERKRRRRRNERINIT